jgi:hypothetical protein
MRGDVLLLKCEVNGAVEQKVSTEKESRRWFHGRSLRHVFALRTVNVSRTAAGVSMS